MCRCEEEFVDDGDPIRFDVHISCGFVYLIKCNNYYKIGWSKRLQSRICSLKGSNPYNVELVHSIHSTNAFKTEQHLLMMFKKYSYKGEWLYIPNNQVKKVVINIIKEMNIYGE